MMKLTALSLALVAAIGMSSGCSMQTSMNQAPRQASSLSDAQAHYALGRFYQGQQRYELAIEAYRKALAAYPGHAGAHNGLGASLLLAGQNAEAIEQFKVGLKHQPMSAALWNNLGYAYVLSGENKLAEMAYKQSLDLDPADYKTNTNLAAVRQSAPPATPAPSIAAQAQPTQAAAAEARTIPLYTAPASAAETAPATTTSAPAAPEPVAAGVALVQTVSVHSSPAATNAAPVSAAPATPTEPEVKLQPSTELAAIAAPALQVAEVTPRVYEMSMADTSAATGAASQSASAPVAGAARISVPLREEVIQIAAVDSNDFVLEIRNGNGVRRMAWRTSQYLAEQGYTTKRLTNQRGFNVKVTRVFYLPGYLAEAERLLAHLPKDTVLTETSNMRRGIHVRVVLGKDMVQQQAAWEAAPEKIQLAALQP
jgi:Flp pilus assembly protein TadD